jgi:hypothetical protein
MEKYLCGGLPRPALLRATGDFANSASTLTWLSGWRSYGQKPHAKAQTGDSPPETTITGRTTIPKALAKPRPPLQSTSKLLPVRNAG